MTLERGGLRMREPIAGLQDEGERTNQGSVFPPRIHIFWAVAGILLGRETAVRCVLPWRCNPCLVLVSLRIIDSQDSKMPSSLPSSDFHPNLESLLQKVRIIWPSHALLPDRECITSQASMFHL